MVFLFAKKENLSISQSYAQWWELSPLTNVDRVQILEWTLRVGWVCHWFSPFLSCRGFSLDTPFSLWAKLTFPNSNLTRNQLDEEPLSECCYLYVVIYYLFIINLLWDVSFIKRVLLNKFKAPVLYVFFSCYSKWLNLLFLFIAIKQEKRKLL